MTDLTILAGSTATINSPTSFTLNSNTDKIGTVEFLTLSTTGIYLEFVMPVGIDGQSDTIYVGLNKKTGPSEPPSNPFYVKLYEDSGSNFEIYINDTIINDFSGKYNADDLLSVYFDGTTVSCCLNGIVINTPRSFPNDGSSYRLYCWMENSLSSKTIHRVKFYPTGLLGLTGPTGPTGPAGPAGLGFTTITGNTSSVAILTADGNNAAIGQENLTYDAENGLLTSSNVAVQNVLTLGQQPIYIHGADGFSFNENFDAGGGNGTQSAYHFTSGSASKSVVFDLAVTTQYTTMFGTYGDRYNNYFIIGSETANTDYSFKTGLGIAPVQLDQGTTLFTIQHDGQVVAPLLTDLPQPTTLLSYDPSSSIIHTSALSSINGIWNSDASSTIYYNRGNVAIGQTATQHTLDISGDLQISNNTIMNKTINRVFINGVSWINPSNVAIDYTYGSNYFIDDSIFGDINQNYTLTIDNLNTDISNSKMNISTLCNIYDTYVAAYYGTNIIVNGTAYTPKFFGGCVYVQPMNSTIVQDYTIYNISGSLTVLTSVSQYSPLI